MLLLGWCGAARGIEGTSRTRLQKRCCNKNARGTIQVRPRLGLRHGAGQVSSELPGRRARWMLRTNPQLPSPPLLTLPSPPHLSPPSLCSCLCPPHSPPLPISLLSVHCPSLPSPLLWTFPETGLCDQNALLTSLKGTLAPSFSVLFGDRFVQKKRSRDILERVASLPL